MSQKKKLHELTPAEILHINCRQFNQGVPKDRQFGSNKHISEFFSKTSNPKDRFDPPAMSSTLLAALAMSKNKRKSVSTPSRAPPKKARTHKYIDIQKEETKSDSDQDSVHSSDESFIVSSEDDDDSSSEDEPEVPELVTFMEECFKEIGKTATKEKYKKEYKEYKSYLRGDTTEEPMKKKHKNKAKSKSKSKSKKTTPTKKKPPTKKPKKKVVVESSSSESEDEDEVEEESEVEDGSMEAAALPKEVPTAAELDRSLQAASHELPAEVLQSPIPAAKSSSPPYAPKKAVPAVPRAAQSTVEIKKDLHSVHFKDIPMSSDGEDDSSDTDEDMEVSSSSDEEEMESPKRKKKRTKVKKLKSTGKKPKGEPVQYTLETLKQQCVFRKCGKQYEVMDPCVAECPVVKESGEAEGYKVDWSKVHPEEHFFSAAPSEAITEAEKEENPEVLQESANMFVFNSCFKEPMIVNPKGFAAALVNYPRTMNIPSLVADIKKGVSPFIINSTRSKEAIRCAVPQCAIRANETSEVGKRLRSIARKQPATLIPGSDSWFAGVFDALMEDCIQDGGSVADMKSYYVYCLQLMRQRTEYVKPEAFIASIKSRVPYEALHLLAGVVPAMMNPEFFAYVRGRLLFSEEEINSFKVAKSQEEAQELIQTENTLRQDKFNELVKQLSSPFPSI